MFMGDVLSVRLACYSTKHTNALNRLSTAVVQRMVGVYVVKITITLKTQQERVNHVLNPAGHVITPVIAHHARRGIFYPIICA